MIVSLKVIAINPESRSMSKARRSGRTSSAVKLAARTLAKGATALSFMSLSASGSKAMNVFCSEVPNVGSCLKKSTFTFVSMSVRVVALAVDETVVTVSPKTFKALPVSGTR